MCVCVCLGKVFSRLKFGVSDELLQGVIAGKCGVIEYILSNLRTKVRTAACHGML